jgi:hypothetical protein
VKVVDWIAVVFIILAAYYLFLFVKHDKANHAKKGLSPGDLIDNGEILGIILSGLYSLVARWLNKAPYWVTKIIYLAIAALFAYFSYSILTS